MSDRELIREVISQILTAIGRKQIPVLRRTFEAMLTNLDG